MQKDDKHIELISKYLAGEATKEEISLLENWVLENETNKRLFNTHKQAWILATTQNTSSKIDVNEEWNKISRQLFQPEAKVVPLPKKNDIALFLKIAAAVLLLIAAIVWLNPFESKPTGQVQKIALNDGSIIHVNKNSNIQYPDKFTGEKRMVTLNGDAFFEVNRDPKHPFVVKAQDITVEVLGTSFYIDSKKNEKFIKVMVRSGKVAMKSDQHKIILEKGSIGIYNKVSKRLLKTKNEQADYIAWVKYSFDFDNPLSEVVQKLNEIYDAHISIENEAMKDCPVTVKFTDQSLEAILNVLSTTLDIKIKQTVGKILLTEGTCKG